jgi:hypothetical protein
MQSPSSAQLNTGELRGQVTDPSGAVVAGATITITSTSGQTSTATSNNRGAYDFKALTPGLYSLAAEAKGFSAYQLTDVNISAHQVQQLDIALGIHVKKEHLEVEAQSQNLDVTSSSNASQTIIKGKDLEALSDDPDELQSDLEALAGPSAGPNGGQIYIDGFTNGQLPPKSSIREIRINQNPFSAQYDRLGFGRVEVFTKPGTDKYHGQVMFNINDSALNAQNPFVSVVPGYQTRMFNGNFGGPLTRKASFFFSVQRRDINDNAVVNAYVLDPNFNQVPFNDAVPTARRRTQISPRLDYQLTQNNTLTARYEFWQNDADNNSVGNLSLASQGFTSQQREHTLQLSDTQVLSMKVINETRFQFNRSTEDDLAQELSPTINVLGAFTGGGNPIGHSLGVINRYEFQNYTSIAAGSHFIRFGARLRASTDTDTSGNNFNGTFTYPSLTTYQITQQGLALGETDAQIRATCIADPTRPDLPPQCGGVSQFYITTGQPTSAVNWFDAGLYVEDDWRLRPNLTLSYGLRFETQTDIADHADFAPRVGIAWGLGRGSGSPKTVLRAGFGMFYDRFEQDLVLQATRLNGTTQRQIICNSPSFYTVPADLNSLVTQCGGVTSPTIYRIDPHLQSPYTMQAAFTIERQIGKNVTLSATYMKSRGVHAFMTRNINAPLPGTYDPNDPTSGVRPLAPNANIYQYSSEGIYKQDQLIVNGNVRGNKYLSLFGFYMLNFANSDTAGANYFPTNQYDPSADFGRAQFDVRQRLFIGGSLSLPYAVRLSPFIVAAAGAPFNITVGQDLNGDSIFNDRPTFATDLTRPSVVKTPYGNFDTSPLPGQQIIPINYGDGPTQFTVNLRLSKTFGIGPQKENVGLGPQAGGHGPGPVSGGPRGPGRVHGHGPGGPFGMAATTNHRYNLTFSASAHNLLNRVNLAPPIGNLNSPLFGVSNALAGGPYSSGSANRRVDLQVLFSF